ncbi:hypothetical protein UA08_09227 [Talaromyces atroroseus]|uniref:FAD dependent oxidoreductase domain-containing protein n=1 Tax=Talaromyces atroroseus TaxID=1441469 RepID=A0A1Q5Q6K1_TALAT|nr:hypothetical protein UA08_09227 [Talaromyces atroroseus]OKL55477.1 hypothetical protein UA08_09227 [Talaromyces atroroseus]
MARNSNSSTVVVIGAGIIGLTIALKLQDLLSSKSAVNCSRVLLVAREWPTTIPHASSITLNYASMWAGAHVRPIPGTTAQLRREAAWLKRTVQEFSRQLKAQPWTGISKTTGIEFIEAPNCDYEKQTSESFAAESGLPGYRELVSSEKPAGTWLGYEYETYCVNAPMYCANLLRTFVLRGGQTVLTSLDVTTKTVTKQAKDGSWSFIIPRGFDGGTIIGGTKEPENWDSEPSLHTREHLLTAGQGLLLYACEASKNHDDALSSWRNKRVIADVVGRRPTRQGGMRIEPEERLLSNGNKKNVIHAYGAGGRGFEISWGVAAEVAEMAKELLGNDNLVLSKL